MRQGGTDEEIDSQRESHRRDTQTLSTDAAGTGLKRSLWLTRRTLPQTHTRAHISRVRPSYWPPGSHHWPAGTLESCETQHSPRSARKIINHGVVQFSRNGHLETESAHAE